jgi:hypothetical protein
LAERLRGTHEPERTELLAAYAGANPRDKIFKEYFDARKPSARSKRKREHQAASAALDQLTNGVRTRLAAKQTVVTPRDPKAAAAKLRAVFNDREWRMFLNAAQSLDADEDDIPF